jgi:hypothetical protein
MRKFLLMAVVLACAFLSGCGKSTPDDELTAKVVRPRANSGVAGVEIVDYRRDNGWVDPQSANRYIVRYRYNWALALPFFDIVLAKAKAERDEGRGEGFDFLDGALEWEAAQDKSARLARIDALKTRCPVCAAWLNQGDEDEKKARLQCFEDVWHGLEQVGFKDTDGAGAKTPESRTASASFVKTEKGWEPA